MGSFAAIDYESLVLLLVDLFSLVLQQFEVLIGDVNPELTVFKWEKIELYLLICESVYQGSRFSVKDQAILFVDLLLAFL